MTADLANRLRRLVREGDFLVSAHGYEEMQNDGILLGDIERAMPEAVMVEAYPDYHKGLCCLFLLHDDTGPVHVLWELATDTDRPAALITAYRPDPDRWLHDFRTHRK